MNIKDRILADIAANGPADHIAITRRLGMSVNHTSYVRRHLDAMANTGHVTFDHDTGRIASLTPTATQEQTP